MKRALIGLLVSAFFITAVASQAEAEKKAASQAASPKKKAQKAKKGKTEQAPESAAISPSLGNIKWGMNREEVQKLLSDQVRDRYRPKIAKITDGIEEDRLTNAQNQEIKKIRDSFTSFDGRTSGWDLGFLRDEFTHNNGESMVVAKDSNSQNYYFFINDKLWKWYKAFNIEVFEGKSFADFADAIQRKFGKGKETEGELTQGAGKRHWIEWQDKSSRLRAVDQTAFYGFYCLVFEDKGTLGNLATLRRNAPERGNKTHAMVESVTSSSNMAADPDESPNIIDRITGKMRTKEAASGEEPGRKGQASSSASSSGSSATSSGSSTTGSGSGFSKSKTVKDDLEF